MSVIAILKFTPQIRADLQSHISEVLHDAKFVFKNSPEDMIEYLKAYNNVDLIICEYFSEGITGIEFYDILRLSFEQKILNRMYPIMLIQNEESSNLNLPQGVEAVQKPKTARSKKEFGEKVKSKIESSKIHRKSYDMEKSIEELKSEINKINTEISLLQASHSKFEGIQLFMSSKQDDIAKKVNEIHSATNYKIIPEEKPSWSNKFNVPAIAANLVVASFNKQPTTTLMILFVWITCLAFLLNGSGQSLSKILS